MRVTIVALLAGLAGGLVALSARPRLRNIPLGPVRWPALLLVAVIGYRLPAWLDASDGLGLGLALAAYAGLVVFAAANVRLRGMVIVLVGLLGNAAVLVANQAMPVDEEAVVAAGVARAEEIPLIDLEPPREWRTSEHRLVLLTDVIPVPPLKEVVSFGDLILAAGLANVVFRMLPPLVGPASPARSRRPRRRRRRTRPIRPAVPAPGATSGDVDWDTWDADDWHELDEEEPGAGDGAGDIVVLGAGEQEAGEPEATDAAGSDHQGAGDIVVLGAGEVPTTSAGQGEASPPEDAEPEATGGDEPAG